MQGLPAGFSGSPWAIIHVQSDGQQRALLASMTPRCDPTALANA